MTPHRPRCDTCRWWSEMHARLVRDFLEAVCLREYGINSGCFTRARQACAGHERGEPVDQERVT